MSVALRKTALQHPALWRGDAFARSRTPGIGTGFPALDSALSDGGWPAEALSEILVSRPGIGELRLLLPALARLSGAGQPLLWVNPPFVPYLPALAGKGVDSSRLFLAHAPDSRSALWVAEEALRSGACGAVLVWLVKPEFGALRRLQLAAESGRCWGALFRPVDEAILTSPAPLRLAIEPCDAGLSVHVLKRRGGMLAAPLTIVIN